MLMFLGLDSAVSARYDEVDPTATQIVKIKSIHDDLISVARRRDSKAAPLTIS